jgi:hypothetical protein
MYSSSSNVVRITTRVSGTLEARAEGQSFRVTARLPYREAT